MGFLRLLTKHWPYRASHSAWVLPAAAVHGLFEASYKSIGPAGLPTVHGFCRLTQCMGFLRLLTKHRPCRGSYRKRLWEARQGRSDRLGRHPAAAPRPLDLHAGRPGRTRPAPVDRCAAGLGRVRPRPHRPTARQQARQRDTQPDATGPVGGWGAGWVKSSAVVWAGRSGGSTPGPRRRPPPRRTAPCPVNRARKSSRSW